MFRAILFDFDGVLADSEVVANAVLAEVITELGHPTSLEDSYRQYMGKRFEEVISAVETTLGTAVPPGFPAEFQSRTLTCLERELVAVSGAVAFLSQTRHLARAVASSSSPHRLALCLDVLGMGGHFGRHVYSASQVARGKPAPDIFLHAARSLEVDPKHCLVIEDSPSGVTAARAAGMTAVGLIAASHIQPDHASRLKDAGAAHVAPGFDDILHWMNSEGH